MPELRSSTSELVVEEGAEGAGGDQDRGVEQACGHHGDPDGGGQAAAGGLE